MSPRPPSFRPPRANLIAAVLAASVTVFLAGAGRARADADEASVDASFWAGGLELGDPAPEIGGAGTGRDRVGGAGASLMVTLASHNAFAYELSLGAGLSRTSRYPATGSGDDLELLRNTRAQRATAGIALRLGARWVPILGMAAGLQRRSLVGGVLQRPTGAVGPAPDRVLYEPIVQLRVGLDRRLDRHWLTGVQVRASLAPGADAAYRGLEAGVHLAYYWYPTWW